MPETYDRSPLMYICDGCGEAIYPAEYIKGHPCESCRNKKRVRVNLSP